MSERFEGISGRIWSLRKNPVTSFEVCGLLSVEAKVMLEMKVEILEILVALQVN